MADGKRLRGYMRECANKLCAAVNKNGRQRQQRGVEIGRKEEVTMNIITYNVRGLGRGVKWPVVRRMVNKQHINMLCIQETKKEVIERSMCQAILGDSEVRWEAQPSSNTVGGILCIWSEKTFSLEGKVIGTGFVMLTRKWIQEAQTMNIINIYSPCDIQSKRVLWDTIKQLKIKALEDYGAYWGISIASGIPQRDLVFVPGEWKITAQGNSMNGLQKWRQRKHHGLGENSHE